MRQALAVMDVGAANESITNDLPLRCEEGQLVFAFLGQSAQLDPMDFRAGKWCQLGDGSGFSKQIRELGIGVLAVLIMCEWFKRWISMALGQ